jgi:CBS domain-containing protein
MGTIFFDFRDLYSEADFVENLSARLLSALEGNRLFLRYLVRNGLYNRPPLGFLRQFVVEKDGDHKNKLNLKLSGLTPLVDAARVLALEQGVLVTGTLARLREVNQRGIIKDALYEDLVEAFSFITILRIRHHLDARSRGAAPDNFLAPSELNNLQRKMLKESFAAISRLQDLLEHRFQTWLIT